MSRGTATMGALLALGALLVTGTLLVPPGATSAAAATARDSAGAAVHAVGTQSLPAVTSIRLSAKPEKTVVGHPVRLRGRVEPARRSVRVKIQRWTGSRWVTAAKARTDRGGRFAARADTPQGSRRTWFRARPAHDRRTVSDNVEVRLTRPHGRSAGSAKSANSPAPDTPAPPGGSPTAPAPAAAPVPLLHASTLSAGGDATCALDSDGDAWCWGGWGGGPSAQPTRVTGTPALRTIAVSAGTACALDRNGLAWCWGDPAAVGGTVASSGTTAVQVAGGHVFTALTGGRGDRPGMCGLDRQGAAWCWGWGPAAAQGAPDEAWGAPGRVAPTATGLTDIVLGAAHLCALDAGRRASCWGHNESGQLGSGDPALGALATNPVAVSGQQTWHRLSAGSDYTCAIATADSRAWCWGGNEDGQLGSSRMRFLGCAAPDGGNDWFCQGQPTLVEGGRSLSTIAAGHSHACGLDRTSRLHCWGDGATGQLGTGTRVAPTHVPQTVAASVSATTVASGRQHTCALGVDARARCWGDGDAGQLGTGTVVDMALAPVDVVQPGEFLLP